MASTSHAVAKKTVGRSIAFRLSVLLLRKEYATSLNPCRNSFLWKGIGHIAASVDKSAASFRESAGTRVTACGKHTFLHVSPKHLHFIPRPTVSRLRRSSPPNNAPPPLMIDAPPSQATLSACLSDLHVNHQHASVIFIFHIFDVCLY